MFRFCSVRKRLETRCSRRVGRHPRGGLASSLVTHKGSRCVPDTIRCQAHVCTWFLSLHGLSAPNTQPSTDAHLTKQRPGVKTGASPGSGVLPAWTPASGPRTHRKHTFGGNDAPQPRVGGSGRGSPHWPHELPFQQISWEENPVNREKLKKVPIHHDVSNLWGS